MKQKTFTLFRNFHAIPFKAHWLVYAIICLLAMSLFIHPDIVETSNHSYVLLESTFSGRFFSFYHDVIAHQNTFYYINNAHYNIFVYFIFALFELPIFIFCKIFSLSVSEPLLYYVGKFVSLFFFTGCAVLVQKIAKKLSFSNTTAHLCALGFALFPPAFFSASIMGQYDSICLFFTLMGLLAWLDNRTLPFVAWFGVAATCKFFPLFLFVPLVLLREKRPLRIILQGIGSLWLLVPTTLLFYGRTGDAAFFNEHMASRLFISKIPAAGDMPIFPALFIILCVAAYLYRPQTKAALQQMGMWFCLAAWGILFLFIPWHPQWLILIAPFVILSLFASSNQTLGYWLTFIMSAGIFLYCFYYIPSQLEANLLDGGIIGLITGLSTATLSSYNGVAFFLARIPMLVQLPMVLFFSALACYIIFSPLRKASSAVQLAARQSTAKHSLFCLWACFLASMAVWAAPTLLAWLNAFQVI